MEVPKFLIADSSTLQDEIFVLHTEYPRFLLNVSNDEILWLEEFGKEYQDELEKITEELIEEALAFFDTEIESLE
jgi:DNA-binding SARP family transcriptional activator